MPDSTFDPFDLVDQTWPAQRFQRAGPWLLREGAGGGQRVSAASLTEAAGLSEASIDAAEAAMADLGQRPLFQVRDAGGALDQALAARGYTIVDPVWLRAGPVGPIAALDLPGLSGFATPWPALAIQREIWADGHTGPARVAVMDRAAGPKAALLARADDRAAGAGFVAGHGRAAMIHALHVLPAMRRRGAARHMMIAAARWAADQGIDTLALAVTKSNDGANALYASLGMGIVGEYHYRLQAA